MVHKYRRVGILVVLVGVFFQSYKTLLFKIVQEDSLASALKKMNNDLLDDPKLVSRQISAEGNVTGTVAGSDLKLAIQSDEEKNSVSYAGNISAETLVYVINRLFGEKYHSDVLESISLYSQSDELLLTNKENQTALFLTFNSLGLSLFLKGNKQYFSIPANVSEFHQKLEAIKVGLLNYQLNKQLNSYSELDMASNVVLEFDLANLEVK